MPESPVLEPAGESALLLPPVLESPLSSDDPAPLAESVLPEGMLLMLDRPIEELPLGESVIGRGTLGGKEGLVSYFALAQKMPMGRAGEKRDSRGRARAGIRGR